MTAVTKKIHKIERMKVLISTRGQLRSNLLDCFMRIEIIMPYMPSTPAMTMGMIDLKTSSGLMTATLTMPTPDLAVPNAEPMLAKARAKTTPMVEKYRESFGSPNTRKQIKCMLEQLIRLSHSHLLEMLIIVFL